MKKNSPEVLKLIVNDVQLKTLNRYKLEVKIKATVIKVIRTETRVQSNCQIFIKYEIPKLVKKGYIGPVSLKALKKKNKYIAYLIYSIENKVYIPSAKGLSFKVIDD
ncbi:hypothetical protein RZR97_04815 [Hydrogenimonas thermophila]|nr:hypothetical protein [Hydrogenimonas thermophila]WOE70897.1 hypothetical protein RZR91_04835 [Hydrogenimonas thermophila]WOE73415.1 hypothetical protein RZR97_04815 [Hydrogenimonas thermophila]